MGNSDIYRDCRRVVLSAYKIFKQPLCWTSPNTQCLKLHSSTVRFSLLSRSVERMKKSRKTDIRIYDKMIMILSLNKIDCFLWKENMTKRLLNFSGISKPFRITTVTGEDEDYAISIRVCNFIFRFFGIFIIQAFSTELASYLSLQIFNLPFNSLEEFVKNGKYRLLIRDEPILLVFRYFAVSMN